MDRHEVEQALARIRAAAERIEVASGRLSHARPAPSEDNELRARHYRLRAEVGQALHQIDELIGGLAA